MEARWYVERGGKQSGPYTPAQLKELVASGRLQPTDKVQKGKLEKPVLAGRVKGLFPAAVSEQAASPVRPAAKADNGLELVGASDELQEQATSDSATGVPGGILHGAILAVFFGGVSATVLTIPTVLAYPRNAEVYLFVAFLSGMVILPPIGIVCGAVVGLINRRTNGAQWSGPAGGGAVGLLVGVPWAAIDMYHRVTWDRTVGNHESMAAYLYIALVLFVMVPVALVVFSAILGTAIGFVIRLRAELLYRALTDFVAGVVAGGIAAIALLFVLFIFALLMGKYGAW